MLRTESMQLSEKSEEGGMALPEAHSPAGSGSLRQRYATVLALFLADVVAVSCCAVVVVWLRLRFGGTFHPSLYLSLWPALFLFVLVYEASGLYQGAVLYPGVALGPAEELRRLTYGTTGVYFALTLFAFFLKTSEDYSRLVLGGAWLLTLVVVPLTRFVTKSILSQWSGWGIPALVLGGGDTGQSVIKALKSHPEFGMRPVGVLDDDAGLHGTEIEGVPVLGALSEASHFKAEYGVKHGILAMPSLGWHGMLEQSHELESIFPHLLIIPDREIFSSLWVTAQDVGGLLGLEIRQKLLLRSHRFCKYVLDITLTLLISLVLSPFLLLLALLVKVSSPGPVLYAARRIGRGDRPFEALKFRTMVQNADQVLEQHLHEHPELREEWKQTFKLKHDPRITRIGWFLRLTSLDELPQLWNVLRGEMSLVGPRPIVQAEIAYYGKTYDLYRKVRPGLTGLWQVSGRSDVTYAERLNLDTYYVRNWSPWLDIYILVRTVRAVLSASGAY
jgi:Undecaprenyl-phosphate galactose phosphotransferase WbaP